MVFLSAFTFLPAVYESSSYSLSLPTLGTVSLYHIFLKYKIMSMNGCKRIQLCILQMILEDFCFLVTKEVFGALPSLSSLTSY